MVDGILPTSTGAVRKYVTLRCGYILVQLSKCREGVLVMGVCFRRFSLNMNVVWEILFVLSWDRVTSGSGECYFGIRYVEWFGVCNFVVSSVVDKCVDYGDVFFLFFFKGGSP